MKEKPLLILDFGAHNNQQVAKIARKFNVYCEVKPYNTDLDLIKKINPKALIFIGDEESKELDAAEKKSKLKDLGIPVLEFGNQKEPEEIKAFIFDKCGFSGNWTIQAFIDDTVEQIKTQVGDKKVLCALSGGVDSSVAAVLVHKAVGDQLTCVFVNHGLMRKDEPEQVEEIFGKQFNMKLIAINAVDRFLDKLAGIDDPEKKRKIIGKNLYVYLKRNLNGWENGYGSRNDLSRILLRVFQIKVLKSHHNVGGLPEDIDFELLSRLNYCLRMK